MQFLDVARTLEGYETVVFPHCACDARKSGHVIVSISLNSFRLQACSDQGDKEVSFTQSKIYLATSYLITPAVEFVIRERVVDCPPHPQLDLSSYVQPINLLLY